MPGGKTGQHTGGAVKYCAGCRKYLPVYAYATHSHSYDRAMDVIIRKELRRRSHGGFSRVMAWARTLVVIGLLSAGAYSIYQNVDIARDMVGQVQALAEERWPAGAGAGPTGPFDDEGNILPSAAGQVVLEVMDALSRGDEARLVALTSGRPDAGGRGQLQGEMLVLQHGADEVIFDSLMTGECGPARCEVTLWAFARDGLSARIYDWAFVVVREEDRLVVAEAHPL
jgi:hypothetical protein